MSDKRAEILKELDEIRGYPYGRRNDTLPQLKRELRFMKWITNFR